MFAPSIAQSFSLAPAKLVTPGGVSAQHEDGGPATETCNIGPAELRRRRQSAVMAAIALAAALLAIGLGVLPRWSLPLLAPLFGAVVGTALQVWMRFCMAFGFAGLVGMGNAPGASAADRALRAGHRRRAALMAGAAFLATLAWAVIGSLLVLATA